MEQGVSGYFDIAGSEKFTGRFFYSEQYDSGTGKRKVSATGISIQSKAYGGTWYPGGPVSVDGETLYEMSYSDPATNWVTIGAAGETWYALEGRTVSAFPWVSGEIESNPDGSKTVIFDVDLKLWRNSSSPVIAIKGSVEVSLTKLIMGPAAYVRRDGGYVLARICNGSGNEITLVKGG